MNGLFRSARRCTRPICTSVDGLGWQRSIETVSAEVRGPCSRRLIDFSDLTVLTGMYGLKPALGVGDPDGDGEIGNSDVVRLMERINGEASADKTSTGLSGN